jgi:hypothetical protein
MSLGGTVWRLQKEVDGLLVENQRLRDCWAEALQNVTARNEEIERLRIEIDAIKRSREQERDYADMCYENERLRQENVRLLEVVDSRDKALGFEPL